MTVCNFCNRRELRSRRFTLPFTCVECEQNQKNKQSLIDGDEITFINASRKEYTIDTDTKLNITISDDSPNVFGNNESCTNGDNNNIDDDKPIDTKNFKDALLASLYNQV